MRVVAAATPCSGLADGSKSTRCMPARQLEAQVTLCERRDCPRLGRATPSIAYEYRNPVCGVRSESTACRSVGASAVACDMQEHARTGRGVWERD